MQVGRTGRVRWSAWLGRWRGMQLMYDLDDITSGRSIKAVLPFVILTEQPEECRKLPVIHALYLCEGGEQRLKPLNADGCEVELTYWASKRALANPASVRKLLQECGDIILGGLLHTCDVKRPNDPSSATRPTGRVDCNSDAMAGLEAMMG